jgi:hypothetical protein
MNDHAKKTKRKKMAQKQKQDCKPGKCAGSVFIFNGECSACGTDLLAGDCAF